MFTGNETQTKGKPLRGYKVMLFTFLMIFLLTFLIGYSKYNDPN